MNKLSLRTIFCNLRESSHNLIHKFTVKFIWSFNGHKFNSRGRGLHQKTLIGIEEYKEKIT